MAGYYVRTPEHRALMAEIKKNQWTPEARKLQSEKTKGRKRSPKASARMSAARFRGGRTASPGSYVLIRNPLERQKLEHRVVMEQHIGRLLQPGEVVHHENRNRSDNRLENLILFSSQKEHLAHHARQRRERKSRESA